MPHLYNCPFTKPDTQTHTKPLVVQAARGKYKEADSMRPLHDLCSAASVFEIRIYRDLKALEIQREAMQRGKDYFKIRDILNTLSHLEYDMDKYKEWAEREAEALEKLTEP